MAARASSSASEIFLNIRVQNKKGIVEHQVTEKFGQDWQGQGIVSLTQKIANDLVSEEKVGREVAQKTVEDLPRELLKNGIKATATLTFRRGLFFVVSVKVLAADFERLAAQGKMSRPVLGLLNCFQFFPAVFTDRIFAVVLKRVVEEMLLELPGQVASDLEERGGVKAAVVALPAEQEANHFFRILEEIKEEEAAAERKRDQVSKAVQDFTGKDEYKFGDITKTILKKAKRSSKGEKSVKEEGKRTSSAPAI